MTMSAFPWTTSPEQAPVPSTPLPSSMDFSLIGPFSPLDHSSIWVQPGDQWHLGSVFLGPPSESSSSSSSDTLSPERRLSECFLQPSAFSEEDASPDSSPLANQSDETRQLPSLAEVKRIVEGNKIARRRAQNREAQRGFRARQAEIVQTLEMKVEELSAERESLKNECENLMTKYNQLKGDLKRLID